MAQRLLRAEILRNFWTLVNLKVCFPFLKDPAKSKGREKGGRYKVLIVPAEFPCWVFFILSFKKSIVLLQVYYTIGKRTWTLNSASKLYPSFVHMNSSHNFHVTYYRCKLRHDKTLC